MAGNNLHKIIELRIIYVLFHAFTSIFVEEASTYIGFRGDISSMTD